MGFSPVGRGRLATTAAAGAAACTAVLLGLAAAGVLTWPTALLLLAAAATVGASGAAALLARRSERRTARLRTELEHDRKNHGKSRAAQQARARAQQLFDDGRIQEAVDEVTPHAAHDEESARQRARFVSMRRSLGPLPPLPEPPVVPQNAVPGRVLHVVTNALPRTQAGYTVRTQRILSAQRAIGLDAHAVTFAGYPTPKDKDRDTYTEVDGVPYHRVAPGQKFPGMFERIDASVDAVTALARELRPAVLHAASGHKNATIALNAGRALGIPVVYELRGLLEESWMARPGAHDRRASEWFRMTMQRETDLVREADAVVTLAETMRARILERGVDPDRVYLAPNAVDESLLSERPDGASFRAAHGIGQEEFVIGSVSSLHRYEGFGTLLEAAAFMRDRDRAVRVLLVGDGEDRDDLIALADRLGIDDTCVFPGRVEPADALRAQAALDAMVVPRLDTGVARLVTPLKPVEAMAYGVPVVASDLPALRELLADGRAGTLVPPADPAALAAALIRLRKDDAYREAQVAQALEEVRRFRTWPSVMETYRQVYSRIGALD
ncbi:glycosyltransferase [Nocardiopsis sp. HNM0947]|uniref:Glycosyltransferase n=1 Tax=Nocardiopsis coralli TaxID=2772213 RepID=A0ABR9P364_9ACTN|nr:glycosyltransferase family 4 protein [Nocardiopsis coralli]MBE2998298.1 glycosyltransferase [Nocardiopsis coralli]